MKNERVVAIVICLMLSSGCNQFGVQENTTLNSSSTPIDTGIQLGPLPTKKTLVESSARQSNVLPGLQECLLTKDGIRRKVITIQSGLRCSRSPNGLDLVNEELPFFKHLFVLDAGPDKNRPEWYCVSKSPRKADRIGYINANVVVEWNTRLGFRFVQDGLVFVDFEAAKDHAALGFTDHEPLARAYADKHRNFLPWPIILSRTVKTNRGNLVEVAKLHVLGTLSSQDKSRNAGFVPSTLSSNKKKELVNAVRVVTVAFCVDNTNSTEPFVRAIIRFINEATSKIHKLRPNLRLAMTLYRDDVAGLRWESSGKSTVTKTLWAGQPQSCNTFSSTVSKIEAPKVPSADWSECGYQGLFDTLNNTQWDSLSRKAIVWIGDNSAHPGGSAKNPSVSVSDIIRVAKARGVAIYAVCIEGAGGDVEQSCHRRQCKQIADATGGEVYALSDDIAQIAAKITSAVETEKEVASKNATELKRIADGELSYADYLKSRDKEELDRRYQFVRLLKSAGYDLSQLEPGVPALASGWAATQLPNGEPIMERMVYVSRRELNVLITELNRLVELMEVDSTAGISQGYHLGVIARVGEQSFFSAKQQGDIPFDAFIAAKGIPLHTGITMKTRDELFAMTADEKFLFKERLAGEVILKLTAARNSDAFKLTGGFDFGWVLETIMP